MVINKQHDSNSFFSSTFYQSSSGKIQLKQPTKIKQKQYIHYINIVINQSTKSKRNNYK